MSEEMPLPSLAICPTHNNREGSDLSCWKARSQPSRKEAGSWPRRTAWPLTCGMACPASAKTAMVDAFLCSMATTEPMSKNFGLFGS